MDEGLREGLLRALVEQRGGYEPPATEDLGALGRIFGARYASSNIAGVTVFAGLLLLFVTLWFGSDRGFERDLITGAIGLISLALGYLFGSARR